MGPQIPQLQVLLLHLCRICFVPWPPARLTSFVVLLVVRTLRLLILLLPGSLVLEGLQSCLPFLAIPWHLNALQIIGFLLQKGSNVLDVESPPIPEKSSFGPWSLGLRLRIRIRIWI